jgi:hypothetical protein
LGTTWQMIRIFSSAVWHQSSIIHVHSSSRSSGLLVGASLLLWNIIQLTNQCWIILENLLNFVALPLVAVLWLLRKPCECTRMTQPYRISNKTLTCSWRTSWLSTLLLYVWGWMTVLPYACIHLCGPLVIEPSIL